jgi:hypothetical protein
MSRDEVRCNQTTANAMIHDNARPVEPVSTFQAAIGVPVFVSEDVPDGIVQIWQDGKMIKEIQL